MAHPAAQDHVAIPGTRELAHDLAAYTNAVIAYAAATAHDQGALDRLTTALAAADAAQVIGSHYPTNSHIHQAWLIIYSRWMATADNTSPFDEPEPAVVQTTAQPAPRQTAAEPIPAAPLPRAGRQLEAQPYKPARTPRAKK